MGIITNSFSFLMVVLVVKNFFFSPPTTTETAHCGTQRHKKTTMAFHKFAYTQGKSDNFQQHAPRNKMTFRGSEVFYGNEQKVYYEMLDDPNKATPLPIDLGFTISGLQLNETGTFLTVFGMNIVVIVMLPAPGVLAAGDQKLRIKSWRIDLFEERGETVIKTAWNPISRYDSELIVLTSANRIYSFDVLVNNNVIPDQEITLQLSEADTSLYGQLDAVSFCLGKGENRFSLYVLASDGNVYALSPFVPKTMIFTRVELEALFDRVVLASIDNKDTAENSIYQKQVKWVSELWKQYSFSIVESRVRTYGGEPEEFLVLNRPNISRSPILQGPFTIQPFPEQLYDFEGDDIESFDLGSDLTGIGFFLQGGAFLFSLQEEPVVFNWSKNELELNLSLLELVKVSYKSCYISSFSCDPTGVYLQSLTNVQRLDLSAWMQELGKAIEDGDINLSQQLTTVNDLTDRSTQILGYGVMLDGDSNLVTLVQTQQQNIRWLENWTKPNTQPVVTKIIPCLSDSTENSTNYSFINPKVSHLLENFDKVLKPVMMRKQTPNANAKIKDFTWEKLVEFNEASKPFTATVPQLHERQLAIHERLVEQRSELVRQLEKIKETKEKLAEVQARNTAAKRVQDTTERQIHLQERVDKLKAGLLAKRGVQLLTQQEQEFVAELDRVKESLVTVSQREARVVTQSTILKNDSQLKKTSMMAGPTGLGSVEQLLRVRQAINREREILDKVKMQVEALQADNVFA